MKSFKRDYPELEGKEVQWFYTDDPTPIIGIVIGCNFFVGLTITDKDDKTHKLCCYNGPNSPQPYEGFGNAEKYEKMFQFKIKQIKDGVCNGQDTEEYGKLISQSNGAYGINMAKCSFES